MMTIDTNITTQDHEILMGRIRKCEGLVEMLRDDANDYDRIQGDMEHNESAADNQRRRVRANLGNLRIRAIY